MHVKLWKFALGVVAAAAVSTSALAQSQQSDGEPKYGGTLTSRRRLGLDALLGRPYRDDPGTYHPIAPFYSLLVRVDPKNPGAIRRPSSATSASDLGETSDDGKTWTFHIRDDIWFHDGQQIPDGAGRQGHLRNKIITPPEGISVRSTEDFYINGRFGRGAGRDKTLIFKLKYPSGVFLPALANPFQLQSIPRRIPSTSSGYKWHQYARQRHRVRSSSQSYDSGRGPFTGVLKYEKYHHKGKPYLDGFKAIVATDPCRRASRRSRGGQADIGVPRLPAEAARRTGEPLGDKITVQESDWNCVADHHAEPSPQADGATPRVRRALDAGHRPLGRLGVPVAGIAIVKTVGGIVFPGPPAGGDGGGADVACRLQATTRAPSRAEAKKSACSEAGLSRRR